MSMVANYCFASAEGRYALFAEAVTRGWLAGIQDFRHLKNREESVTRALQECDVLRAEVCCVHSENIYRTLVISAYVSSYLASEQGSEHHMVVSALALKDKSRDEALAILRRGFERGAGRTQIDKGYAQFREMFNLDEGNKR